MEKYRVMEKPLFLKGGILTLTSAQAEPRKHLLKNMKKSKYNIEKEVCFKVGEIIGIEEKVAKTLLKIGLIEYEDKAAAEEKAKAKAEAEAKAKEEAKAKAEAEAKAKEEAEAKEKAEAEAKAEEEGKDNQGLAGRVLDKVMGKDKDKDKANDPENPEEKSK